MSYLIAYLDYFNLMYLLYDIFLLIKQNNQFQVLTFI